MAPKKQSTQPVVTEQTPVVVSAPVVVQTASAPSEPVVKKVTKRTKTADKVDVVQVAPTVEPAVQQTIAPIVVASEPVVAEKKTRAKKAKTEVAESVPVVAVQSAPEPPKVEVQSQPVAEVAQPKKGGNKKAKAEIAPAPVVEAKVEPVAVAPSAEVEKPKRVAKGKKGVEITVDLQPVSSTPVVSVASQPVVVVEPEKKSSGRKKKTIESAVEIVAPQPTVQVQAVTETVVEKPAKQPRAKKVKVEVEPQVAVVPAPVVEVQNAEAVAPPKKGRTYFKLEYENTEIGRYSSKSHKASSSSSKAFNKLLSLKRKNGQSDAELMGVQHEFVLRECNRRKHDEKAKHKFIGVARKMEQPVSVEIKTQNVQLRDPVTNKPLRDANGVLLKEKKPLIVHQQGPNGEYLFNEDKTPKMGPKLIWHFYSSHIRKCPKPPVVLTEKQIQRREARQARLAQKQAEQTAPVAIA